MDDAAPEPPAAPVTADTATASTRPGGRRGGDRPAGGRRHGGPRSGPWFEDALASVAGQSYPSCTLLVVDAASTLPLDDRAALGAWGARAAPR
ncbi:MAG: hypothetical protein R2699_05055 [Acidimicrobiales bacterium]